MIKGTFKALGRAIGVLEKKKSDIEAIENNKPAHDLSSLAYKTEPGENEGIIIVTSEGPGNSNSSDPVGSPTVQDVLNKKIHKINSDNSPPLGLVAEKKPNFVLQHYRNKVHDTVSIEKFLAVRESPTRRFIPEYSLSLPTNRAQEQQHSSNYPSVRQETKLISQNWHQESHLELEKRDKFVKFQENSEENGHNDGDGDSDTDDYFEEDIMNHSQSENEEDIGPKYEDEKEQEYGNTVMAVTGVHSPTHSSVSSITLADATNDYNGYFDHPDFDIINGGNFQNQKCSALQETIFSIEDTRKELTALDKDALLNQVNLMDKQVIIDFLVTSIEKKWSLTNGGVNVSSGTSMRHSTGSVGFRRTAHNNLTNSNIPSRQIPLSQLSASLGNKTDQSGQRNSSPTGTQRGKDIYQREKSSRRLSLLGLSNSLLQVNGQQLQVNGQRISGGVQAPAMSRQNSPSRQSVALGWSARLGTETKEIDLIKGGHHQTLTTSPSNLLPRKKRHEVGLSGGLYGPNTFGGTTFTSIKKNGGRSASAPARSTTTADVPTPFGKHAQEYQHTNSMTEKNISNIYNDSSSASAQMRYDYSDRGFISSSEAVRFDGHTAIRAARKNSLIYESSEEYAALSRLSTRLLQTMATRLGFGERNRGGAHLPTDRHELITFIIKHGDIAATSNGMGVGEKGTSSKANTPAHRTSNGAESCLHSGSVHMNSMNSEGNVSDFSRYTLTTKQETD